MKKITLFLLLTIAGNVAIAQSFVPPTTAFSSKKSAYFFMENGDKVICNIKSLKWKKGLIEELKIIDPNGKKVKISPEDISNFYGPSSGLNKLTNAMGEAFRVDNLENSDLDAKLLAEKLSYFEQSDVKLKKKTFTVMVQVMNPAFCAKIRVYNDPYAKETTSLGVGGMTVAGGDAKSYYVKMGSEEVATKREKKNYSEEFKLMFSDAPELIKKYGDAPKWKDFQMHVWEYSQEVD